MRVRIRVRSGLGVGVGFDEIFGLDKVGEVYTAASLPPFKQTCDSFPPSSLIIYVSIDRRQGKVWALFIFFCGGRGQGGGLGPSPLYLRLPIIT